MSCPSHCGDQFISLARNQQCKSNVCHTHSRTSRLLTRSNRAAMLGGAFKLVPSAPTFEADRPAQVQRWHSGDKLNKGLGSGATCSDCQRVDGGRIWGVGRHDIPTENRGFPRGAGRLDARRKGGLASSQTHWWGKQQ
jgi:hypothetical protein